MRSWRRAALFALALIGWFACNLDALAQAEALTLYVRRNFGYGGGSQIQGNFRLEVEGPADLVSVTYLIDGEVLATIDSAPFRVDFETDAHPHGWHDLTAIGRLADGRAVTSNTRRFEFVSAEVGWQAAGQIGGTLLGGVAVVIVVVLGLQVLVFGRGSKARRPGDGWLGGAVCGHCGHAFSIHLWSLNAVGARFDRCDHCGKWSLVRRASPAELEAAEAAFAPVVEAPPADQAAERDRRRLDDTRYVDDV